MHTRAKNETRKNGAFFIVAGSSVDVAGVRERPRLELRAAGIGRGSHEANAPCSSRRRHCVHHERRCIVDDDLGGAVLEGVG